MRNSLTRFVAARKHPTAQPDRDLIALLDHVQKACGTIAKLAAQGALRNPANRDVGVSVRGEEQMWLDVLADSPMSRCCQQNGPLRGMLSEELTDPYRIPEWRCCGRYLLVFEPLDGSSNIDVDMTVGSIFSILRAPAGVTEPGLEGFLQPGTEQAAAGYAIYGPATQLVMSLGAGVDAFRLDAESGSFILTHPGLRIPETAREFAINASNRRFWEPPVRRYFDECVEGAAGPRGVDFNMRWTASLVAEVHRLLIRGGVFLNPPDSKDPKKNGRLRLIYEANPMAMLVEQAGGAGSTGRRRILEITPHELHQSIPVVLGAKLEVERLLRYHEAYDRGEDSIFEAPLFHSRSLFRSM
jgi:fructose-1,6-bisphosphatase